MAKKNIFQKRITPDTPRTLREERVFVYVPKATSRNAGISSFPSEEFTVDNSGEVNLRWSMKDQIENSFINDPLKTIARSKLQSDEFVHTDDISTIKHPISGVFYKNTVSSVKFKRTGQNLFKRPGFVMLDSEEFETVEIDSNDRNDRGTYIQYKLKQTNPFLRPSVLKVDKRDFLHTKDYDGDETKSLKINWTYAHLPNSGSGRTNGFGLVKIKPNSEGYLTFKNDYLSVDTDKLLSNTSIAPTYGGIGNGFDDYSSYIDEKGVAKKDSAGRQILKITKDAVGLSKVENKSFSQFEYTDFGLKMKTQLGSLFASKEKWDNLFGDWTQPFGTTVQGVIDGLKATDDSIVSSLKMLKGFLGFYKTVADLETLVPASEDSLGCLAYVEATRTYWQVMIDNNGAYVWTDISVTSLDPHVFTETDPNALQPDGNPTVGNSGKYVHSNHIHPTDTSKLDKTVFQNTKILVNSEFTNGGQTDFIARFNDGGDIELNLPYVRTSKSVHNYNNNLDFRDDEEHESYYWSGNNTEFETQKDIAKPGTFFLVEEEDESVVLDLVTTDTLSISGITGDNGVSSERFVIIDQNDADELVGSQFTMEIDRVGKHNRYKLKSRKYQPHSIIVSDENGNFTSGILEEDIARVNNIIKGQLLVADNDNTISSLNINKDDGGIIVADGNGAIKSASFSQPGYLLETAGRFGNTLAANILVSDLVVTETDELLKSGFVFSNGNGKSVIKDFGDDEGMLLVTDGNKGMKVSEVEGGRLLWLDEITNKVAAFPSTPYDVGKALLVQSNGKIALSKLPGLSSNLPVTSITELGVTGYTFQFGKVEQAKMEENVLYLW